jgi:hypothetical protein
MRGLRTITGVVITVAISAAASNTRFFPESIDQAGMHGLKAHWYLRQLQGLHEPSLFALTGKTTREVYRFLWLRTFHHPIAVRMDIQPDGTGMLTTKMCSGAGGYSPGKLVQNSNRKLDWTQVKEFLALIEREGFWTAPNPVNDQTGTDGSQWIIEGVKGGNYHVIDRWSPKQGPAHDLGLFLAFDLAKIDIPKNEIY